MGILGTRWAFLNTGCFAKQSIIVQEVYAIMIEFDKPTAMFKQYLRQFALCKLEVLFKLSVQPCTVPSLQCVFLTIMT